MSDTKRTSLASIAETFTSMYRSLKGSFGNESKGDGVHNAGQPLAPREQDATPLQYQFRLGQNLTTQPREQLTSFQTLRTLADTLDLIRIAIEMRKEQVRGLDWDIVNAEQDDKNDYADDIKRVKAFWKKPDGINSHYDWMGMLLEEVLVIDALSLYKRRNRKGDLFGVEVVDGTTIKPLIDAWGRTPIPPLPAYQQIIYGYPQGQYTLDELIYKPRNKRAFTPYGCSPVEWILMTVNIALRKQQFTLGYFTEGNMPDGGIYQVPETWTPAQIKQYQEYWDAMMTGNMANRQKMRFVPKGGYTATKTFEFSQEFEEWLARLVCTAFQINSQPFLKFTNRATAEVQDDQQTDFGLRPLCLYLETIFTDIIETDLGCPHLKFKFTSEKAADEALTVDKNVKYVAAGIYSIDEVRTAEGKDPLYTQGLPPFIMVQNKPVFLTKEILDKMLNAENFQTPSEAQESAMSIMQGQADAKAKAMGGKPEEDEEGKPAQTSQAGAGQKKKPPEDDDKGKGKRPPTEAEKAVLSELKKWEKFALNRLGKSSARDFEPTDVPAWLADRIKYDLSRAETDEDIRNVFKAGTNKMVRANMELVEGEIEKLKKDLAKEFSKSGQDFLAWLDKFNTDPTAALEEIYGYQFVGVSFRDRAADAVMLIHELGWEDGVRTLNGLLNDAGAIEVEFSSVQAGRWAQKYAARMVTGLNSRTGEMVRRSIKDIVTEGVKNELKWEEIKGQLSTVLQGNHAFSERRCELIARTESAMAYNIGAVDAWQKSEVVEALYVYDGDYDAACREVNGKTWTFDEALFEPIEHPNCWREFFPILTENIHRFDKFNPYHDARGRFTSHGGARSESFSDGRRYKVEDIADVHGETHNMRYIEYMGVKIGAPRNLDADKQFFKIEDIKAEIAALPKPLLESTTAVHLLDKRNPQDPHWQVQYNDPRFRSFATGGTGTITFYQNKNTDAQWSESGVKDYLGHTIRHESAHNFDRKAGGDTWLSNSSAWREANREGEGRTRNYVSAYSRSSNAYVEDFADSVALQIKKPAWFAHNFPERNIFIQEHLYGNAQPRLAREEYLRASAKRRGLL